MVLIMAGLCAAGLLWGYLYIRGAATGQTSPFPERRQWKERHRMMNLAQRDDPSGVSGRGPPSGGGSLNSGLRRRWPLRGHDFDAAGCYPAADV